MNTKDPSVLRRQAKNAAEEIIEISGIKKGSILVVGCSSSEIIGEKLGTNSDYDVAAVVFDAINDACKEKGIFLAAQCCEHLNRAIIIERAAVSFSDICSCIPQKKAGGSFAANAYNAFSDPVAVEHIRADAGLDIGLTLIGMHLREVAVPVRLVNNKIGDATVAAARTRPKFIGGVRAVYDESLL